MRAVAVVALVAGCSGPSIDVSWSFKSVESGRIAACPPDASVDVSLVHLVDEGYRSLSGFPRWTKAGQERVERYRCDDGAGTTAELDDAADNPEGLPTAFSVSLVIKDPNGDVTMRSQALAFQMPFQMPSAPVHFDLLYDGGYFLIPTTSHYSFLCFGATDLLVSIEGATGVIAYTQPCAGVPMYLYTCGLPAGTYKVWVRTLDEDYQVLKTLVWSDQTLLANNDVELL